jgi:hypothetical protein
VRHLPLPADLRLSYSASISSRISIIAPSGPTGFSKAPADYDALGAARHLVGANIRGEVVDYALGAMAPPQ